ncbi:hypothetical protein SSS_07956 [Sarcoptes scabiei]|uniref:Uncharacterized protein n=1 Tax=Sarcoptes scabiei TaxID=52283 RepID=A0A834RG27_SARSC|nr:hypothetical protein SSS_07956 [Sarcoptes scabiei]UXI15517.1 kelch-like protein 10 [Sarcoptes scabiei]
MINRSLDLIDKQNALVIVFALFLTISFNDRTLLIYGQVENLSPNATTKPSLPTPKSSVKASSVSSTVIRSSNKTIESNQIDSQSNSNESQPSCNRSDMDHCTQKLIMILDKHFHYPSSLEEMNKRCREMKPLGRCIREHSRRCLSNGVRRHSFSLLVHSVAKANRGLCRTIKRRRSFASFGICANRLQKRMNTYVDDMNRALFGIIRYPNKKLRIPLSCCNYYKFKERVLKLYNDECGEHAIEMKRLLNTFTRDSLTFVCGSYSEHSEKCSEIITKTPEFNATMKSEVFISTYVDMIDNFI